MNDTIATLLFLLDHINGRRMMVDAHVHIYNAANYLYRQLSMDERNEYHSIVDNRSAK